MNYNLDAREFIDFYDFYIRLFGAEKNSHPYARGRIIGLCQKARTITIYNSQYLDKYMYLCVDTREFRPLGCYETLNTNITEIILKEGVKI